jgi:hypothetical protein
MEDDHKEQEASRVSPGGMPIDKAHRQRLKHQICTSWLASKLPIFPYNLQTPDSAGIVYEEFTW